MSDPRYQDMRGHGKNRVQPRGVIRYARLTTARESATKEPELFLRIVAGNGKTTEVFLQGYLAVDECLTRHGTRDENALVGMRYVLKKATPMLGRIVPVETREARYQFRDGPKGD
jgi:hypothetical protein